MSDIGILVLPTPNPNSYYGLSATTGQVAFANNVAAFTLIEAGRPAGLYRADVSIIATALATLAANTHFDITHTDAVGSVTESVPLDVGGVVGATFDLGTKNRASGSLIFRSKGIAIQNGLFAGALVQGSIGGITTPGALAATYEVVLTRIAP